MNAFEFTFEFGISTVLVAKLLFEAVHGKFSNTFRMPHTLTIRTVTVGLVTVELVTTRIVTFGLVTVL